MKLLEWIKKEKRLTTRNLENMDIEEQDDKVIIPKWQFAIFVHAFREYRSATLMYALMILALVGVMFILSIWG